MKNFRRIDFNIRLFWAGRFNRWKTTLFVSLAIIQTLVLTPSYLAMQQRGSLYGEVKDELGGVIINAEVVLIASYGAERVTKTDSKGLYTFNNLSSGAYTLRASTPGFAITWADVVVNGPRHNVDITMRVAPTREEISVSAEWRNSVGPDSGAGAIILRERDLESLPDDAEGILTILKAMADISAGATGGQLYVDGFTGNRVPPKSSIKEVRINSDPYSAEYDRTGFGRIEIFTKVGADQAHGEAYFSFNNETLNSRNPLILTRTPYEMKVYGARISGPLIARKASFSVDFERNEINDNAIVNAQTLDSNLLPLRINRSVLVPRRFISLYPRLDYQLNSNNTLTARYVYKRWNDANQGVGEFSLPSQAYTMTAEWQSLNMTETTILNNHLANEIRLQVSRQKRGLISNQTDPTIVVLDGFIDGGSQSGMLKTRDNRYELHNYSTWVNGNHTLRFGARLRVVEIADFTQQNFNGVFLFAGGVAPQLSNNNQTVLDPDTGQIASEQITSLERYRRTLLFLRMGLLPGEVRKLGGGATQFSITNGKPEINIRQQDIGAFLQDNWRIRPNLTLGIGLRYELQSNIHSPLNFAPRIGFTWSPQIGNQKRSTIVFRGGAGIFYERIGETLVLNAFRLSSAAQTRYVASDPLELDAFPQIPSPERLSLAPKNRSVTQLARDIRSPYMLQASFGIDKEFSKGIMLSATFSLSRMLHTLRSRNINAPIGGNNIHPLGDIGNVLAYESNGRYEQTQFMLGINKRMGKKVTVFANYTLNKAMSDTDGANYFPADSYDLSREFGRASTDMRHNFYVGSSISTFWGISLNPMLFILSGRPFNITTGLDTNGDTVFQERPAIADAHSLDAAVTAYGRFNLMPSDGQATIPRNFGQGPSSILANLRMSRSFSLGVTQKSKERAQGAQTTSPNKGKPDSKYNLTLSLEVRNILNHVNFGVPVGNLSSPFFGQSNTLSGGGRGGNRIIIGHVRFSF